MAPPAKLVLLTVLANLLVTLQNIIHISGLNFVQKEVEIFINSSCFDHYGKYLDDRDMSLLFGALTALPFLVAVPAMTVGKFLAEKYGRKFTLFLVQSAFALMGGPLFSLAKVLNSFEVLFLGRVMYGVSYSLYITLLPLYIAECCPPKYLGSISTFGAFLNNVLSCSTYVLALPQFLGNVTNWNCLFLIPTVPTLILIGIYRWIPETPKYLLVNRKDERAASSVVEHLYGSQSNTAVVLKGFLREADQAEQGMSLKDIWGKPHLRKAFLISLAVAVSRTTCGYMLVYMYSITIIEELLGLDGLLAKYATISLTVITTFASLVAILMMHRIGRRKAFLGGLASMVVLMALFVLFSVLVNRFPDRISLAYAALACLLLAAVCFDLGPASVTLYLVNEVTPQNARAKCTVVSSSVSILVRLLYLFLYPVIQDLISVYTILILIVIPTSLILVFLYFAMPETSKVPVHEIVDKWVEEKTAGCEKNSDDKNQISIFRVPIVVDVCGSRKFSLFTQHRFRISV